MRKLAVAAVAASLFFGGMGAAVADSWKEMTMHTNGASFKGRYTWQPKNQPPSGLHIQGVLRDESAADDHNVYIESKIAEYPKKRIKGIQKGDVRVDKVLYDPALQITRKVEVRLCRDRGSFRPDNCSPLRTFERN
ncbi:MULTISPECIES: hypothetical protein [unclassified Streptomyces]|uniref:hypothetical protein n=1 Tax=unclassified Streptomyces TaxID=2593676 RepID=UPI0036CD5405